MAKQAAEREDDHVEEPEDKTPAKPQVKENDEDGTVTVDLEPQRKPRKERRQERQDDEVGRLRTQLEEERRARSTLEQQVARGFQDLQQRTQPQGEDPARKRQLSIRAEQENIQTMLRTGVLTDPTAVENARKRFYELEDEQQELIQDRIAQRAANMVAQRQPKRDGEAEEAIIRSEFPDVVANPSAVRYAMGEYYRLTSGPNPEPQTLATSRKAMKLAAEAFKLRVPEVPPVPPSQQQRYGSITAQAGAKPGGAEIHLSKAQKAMAVARWPDLEENEAFVRMARTVQGIE